LEKKKHVKPKKKTKNKLTNRKKKKKHVKVEKGTVLSHAY
jgi:hypothetical protein